MRFLSRRLAPPGDEGIQAVAHMLLRYGPLPAGEVHLGSFARRVCWCFFRGHFSHAPQASPIGLEGCPTVRLRRRIMLQALGISIHEAWATAGCFPEAKSKPPRPSRWNRSSDNLFVWVQFVQVSSKGYLNGKL